MSVVNAKYQRGYNTWIGSWGVGMGLALQLSACGHADQPAEPAAVNVATESEALQAAAPVVIGDERSVPTHLRDGKEFTLPIGELLSHGSRLFAAMWTIDEGGGRPLTKGTGGPVVDPASPLLFPRNFNRISAPDSNSCTACHNKPFEGGGGDFVTNAFVPAQRFDFATFDRADTVPTRGAVDEVGRPVTLQTIGNARATLGLVGSGFIEMLARQITAELQARRDALAPGASVSLESKGISYGTLRRNADGSWDTSGVEGLPGPSAASSGPANPPSLLVLPFHQSAAVVSIRQFTNNAFNHHHGIQSTERFGVDTDPDGDGFENELTRADVTAAAVFQATLAVPGRVIPRNHQIETAVLAGEEKFAEIACTRCHKPQLPLTQNGWIFSEPNPYNPEGNLQPGQAPALSVDLTSNALPLPRLKARRGVVEVPAFTDLKLHDITSGPDDPNADPIDLQQPAGSAAFFAGTRRFLTKKLWGGANEPPFFHHGKFTTLRQAILAHAGEALAEANAFRALGDYEQRTIIEFLKTLQVLPPGTRSLIVDEKFHPRSWPPASANAGAED